MKRWLIALTLLAVLSAHSWSDEPAKPAKWEGGCDKACGPAPQKPAEAGRGEAGCPDPGGGLPPAASGRYAVRRVPAGARDLPAAAAAVRAVAGARAGGDSDGPG